MRYSIYGRPRHVTDADIEEILEWHRKRQSIQSMKQLASRLGLSTTTVANVIRTNGAHYKTPSPEKRAAAIDASRVNRAELKQRFLIE